MFRKVSWISGAIVSLFFVFWLGHTCLVTQKDLSLYCKYLEKQKQLSSQSLAETSRQTREQVQKDIWFSQESATRLHYKIESQSSELVLVPTKNKFEIIENLRNMKCWMQEKVYDSSSGTPMQQIRFIKADEGVYRYNQQELVANTVSLSLFRLPGSELSTDLPSQKAFLRGIAKDVTLTVSGKTPQFNARDFKATLREE